MNEFHNQDDDELPPPRKEKMVSSTIYLKERQVMGLKTLARKREQTIALLVRKAVDQFLEREMGKGGE
jgi:hypothetical protein